MRVLSSKLLRSFLRSSSPVGGGAPASPPQEGEWFGGFTQSSPVLSHKGARGSPAGGAGGSPINSPPSTRRRGTRMKENAGAASLLHISHHVDAGATTSRDPSAPVGGPHPAARTITTSALSRSLVSPPRRASASAFTKGTSAVPQREVVD